MKLVEEFRDPTRIRSLVEQIKRRATQTWTIMEVCGGQTHGLLRHGLDTALAGTVRLIHGPGCPVCVTSIESIDLALELAHHDDVLVTSFGDMLRVPGTGASLAEARAEGGNVQMVYSPLDAVQLAQQRPHTHVVFFAVGFETTAPATALAVHQARKLKLDNFSLLVSHVRVIPAMELVASNQESSVQAFLAAGHVCAVTGWKEYESFVQRNQLPVVVTGFEPVDLLHGILECVEQLETDDRNVSNQYRRSVASDGNPNAQRLVEEAYEVCDQQWRGLGVIPDGGLQLRSAFSNFDARVRFGSNEVLNDESTECRSGEVLIGRIRPTECQHFGIKCTPQQPMGAPMVSAEGACSAYFRYSKRTMSNEKE